ncbi:unnamed protein product [Effrenium voratum]|nr:unnamed protein product [Effrenium voratum]
MAGTGECESHDEEEMEVAQAWLQASRMRLEAAQLKDTLREAQDRNLRLRAQLEASKIKAAEAEQNRARAEELNQKLAAAQNHLVFMNHQTQKVKRDTLEAHRAEDPTTARLRGEVRRLGQRNAALCAARDRLAAQLQELEGTSEAEEATVSASVDPKREQLPHLLAAIQGLEQETGKLKEARASAEERSRQAIARETKLRNQLAASDRKLETALAERQAEHASRTERLQEQLRERYEAIDACQKDADRVMLELEEWQKECDVKDAEIKDRHLEKVQRSERQSKIVVVQLRSEKERLSTVLLEVERDQQTALAEAERLRWFALLTTVASVVVFACAGLRMWEAEGKPWNWTPADRRRPSEL